MPVNPIIVSTARNGWRWQWNQLMNSLAPADEDGNYIRPESQHKLAIVPLKDAISKRSSQDLPILIIGKTCPWAHRTWLMYTIRKLDKTLSLYFAKADHKKGRWHLDPKLMNCDSLNSLYKICGTNSQLRSTVPTLIDPISTNNSKPSIMGNESAQIVEVLNRWPSAEDAPNLLPSHHHEEINYWESIIQNNINDGVYKCGFARNQDAYNKASKNLFNSLRLVESNLSNKGPWLCGDSLTIADIRLFPTLIRWETIYSPLFGCSEEPLSKFSNICKWRKRLFNLQGVEETCNAEQWREDYFGALFPLRPSNIIPNGPTLSKLIN